MNAMMRCGSEYNSSTNYGEIAAEYIDYIIINDNYFSLYFNGRYKTERYMVMRFEPSPGGFIVMIDFKTYNGKLLIYSDSPYNSQYLEFKTTFKNDKTAIDDIELDGKNYTVNIDDDFYPNQMSNVKYCAIINNGDDETMYSQVSI